MVIVSACQAISTAKGPAEGAEDGVRDTVYALRISVHWAIRRRVPRLGKPGRAIRSSRDRSDEGLVFVISRAALLFNRSKRAASEELRPLQTMLPYSIPGLMLNA